MKLASGKLNQRIEIYSDADIKNSSGGVDPNGVSYWATAAMVEPLSSGKSLQANQEVLKPTFRFTVRDRSDKTILKDMYIKWRGKFFSIISAIPDYVYLEALVITAVTKDLPKRIAQEKITIEYGYSDTDYHDNESSIIFDHSMEVNSGVTELTIPFPIAASGQYLYFKIPTGQIIFNKYYINETNEGDIPSFRWYTPEGVLGDDYYLTRSPIVLDEQINNIIFTRNGL